MPPLVSNFIDALGQPAMRHAMVGHFPIVLSLVGFPIAVWAAIASRNGKAVRLTALVLYGLLAVSSYATTRSADRLTSRPTSCSRSMRSLAKRCGSLPPASACSW